MAKKTNFISYELKKLDSYIKQLQAYLDDNPPDLMVDRIELLTSTRGNTIIKVIASKEDQIKMFLTALEKLPKLLEDINRLRKTVSGEEEKNIRGNQSIPGFMQIPKNEDKYSSYEDMPNETEEEIPYEDDEIIEKPSDQILLPENISPTITSVIEDNNSYFDWDDDLRDE